ncbi:MAG: hypothetical protein P4L83_01100 [Nevskia sp.]|nr:hypothetical protein [Nevskia sp.]
MAAAASGLLSVAATVTGAAAVEVAAVVVVSDLASVAATAGATEAAPGFASVAASTTAPPPGLSSASTAAAAAVSPIKNASTACFVFIHLFPKIRARKKIRTPSGIADAFLTHENSIRTETREYRSAMATLQRASQPEAVAATMRKTPASAT